MTNKAMIRLLEDVEMTCQDLEILMNKKTYTRDLEKSHFCKEYICKFRKTSLEKIYELCSGLASKSDYYLKKIEEKMKVDPKQGARIKNQKNKREEKIFYRKNDIRLGFMISGEEEKNYSARKIPFDDIGCSSYTPQNLSSGSFLMKILWTSYDYLTPEKYSPYLFVGGVIDVTNYLLPLQPIESSDWKMKPIPDSEDTLVEIPFPKPDANGKINFNENLLFSIKIECELPKNIFLRGVKLEALIWLKENQEWLKNEKYIYDFQVKENRFEFSTKILAPIAIFQERRTDFPYKSWDLRSVDRNTVLLDVEGKRLHMRFEITPGYVKLKKCNETQLDHLTEIDMEPSELLFKLQKCGVNLLPLHEDAEYCSIPIKDIKAEEKALDDMGIGVRSYYFKSSKWNLSLPRGKFIL